MLAILVRKTSKGFISADSLQEIFIGDHTKEFVIRAI